MSVCMQTTACAEKTISISTSTDGSTTPGSTPTLIAMPGMSIPSPYMLGGRKTSSSFSDLGDFDEFSDVGTPEKPGLFKQPIHEEIDAFRLNAQDENGDSQRMGRKYRHDSGIKLLAGEVLKMRVDNAAYIVFYKADATTTTSDSLSSSALIEPSPFLASTDDSSSSSEGKSSASSSPILTYETPGIAPPPKSFGAMGAAGHKVLTTDCFQRYSTSTRGGTLGRGLFRASTHVGSALVKGTNTLISQTYEGGARGGVFGFAKGLGLGVWGFGSHTVKGAFRSVGHMTNVVGEMVLGMDPHFSLDGALVLTNYRLVWTSTAGDTLDIPIASIVNMETAVTAPHVLFLECKHLLRPKFAFGDERTATSLIDATLAMFSQGPYTFSTIHFEAIRSGSCLEDVDGQEASSSDVYDPIQDYSRLGLVDDGPDGLWQLVDNSDYILFPTYPHTFVVPRGLTYDDLVDLSTYRSAGRIPAVVWRHPHTAASLCRCAQPCAGLSGFASEADKKIVRLLTTGSTFHFFDARSQMAAAGNVAHGKGTEDIRNYPQTELRHCDIVNIHGVRSSYTALAGVCQPNGHGTPADGEALQRTLWLQHLSSLLFTASAVSQLLCAGESVMVHCSDGWDRTSQLAGLIEVMLDPYYRTFRGFLELVDKEWCSFGHMFRSRGAVGDPPNGQEVEDQSPVFVQWLDTMWQVWRQVPWAFEFSDELLATLYTNVYSGLFGTFQYNSEQEKLAKEAKAPTRSLWRYLLSQQHEYMNVQYNATQSQMLRGRPLPVLALESDLALWDAHIACADPICRKYT
ncbi:hypothetical protein Ae201684P_020897 [Aphanomyces euteiches]|uniref:Myotubularin phosphatase domain-containing protein n=1 Tax=Aphanomyces euteiches TaxID=100861 RepID=A0A6G0WXF6_9STRA|nr:hypothetical protein Ae201684_010832 [Aphanomyces euteiches]KAH9061562.1 hypothetical protein Ae201684P_020897 [Aphanomyces euteiches]KAH9145727.1 hypothetical protein AeRB84_010381 [Aphanomyces euteiches]